MVKALVKTRDMYIDEKLNLLVIRDTPEAIRMVERLIATQDLAEPEVMLELEVLEVSSNLLYDLGIRYPDSVSMSLVGAAGTPGSVTLREWRDRSSDLVRLTVPNPFIGISFRNELGRSNVLAVAKREALYAAEGVVPDILHDDLGLARLGGAALV